MPLDPAGVGELRKERRSLRIASIDGWIRSGLGSLQRHPGRLIWLAVVGLSVLFGILSLVLPPIVALGASVVLVIALGILVYPFLGMLGLLILEYVRIIDLVSDLSALHPSLFLATWVLISWLVHTAVLKRSRFVISRQLWVLGGLMIVMGFSIFGAYVQSFALDVLKGFMEYVIFFFLVTQLVDSRRKIRVFLWGYVIGNVCMAFLALPKLLYSYEAISRGGLGLGPFLGDGNDFALAMNMVIPIAFFLIWSEKSLRLRLVSAVSMVVLSVSVLFSLSRGGTITLLATGVMLLFRSPKKRYSLLLIGAMAVALLTMAPPRYFDRMRTMWTFSEDASAQGRLSAWEASIRMAGDQPLVGVGPGNFHVMYGLFYRPADSMAHYWLAAHSLYFQILGELGYTGLFLLLGLVMLDFGDNRKTRSLLRSVKDSSLAYYSRMSNALDVSLVAFLVGAAFLSAAYYPHLFVLTGIVVALRNTALRSTGEAGLSRRRLA